MDTQNSAGTSIDSRNTPERFYGIIVAPYATRAGWRYMRPFLAFDACHCTSHYHQTLTITVCIDGSNQILPVACALVQGEGYKTWYWFNQNLNIAFPSLVTDKKLVIMSDIEKVLAKEVEEELPIAIHPHCCQHIAANIQSQFGIEA